MKVDMLGKVLQQNEQFIQDLKSAKDTERSQKYNHSISKVQSLITEKMQLEVLSNNQKLRI